MDIEEYYIDYYMDQLKEQDNLNEVDPFTAGVTLGVGTVWTIGMLVSFLVNTSMLRKRVKVDKLLSKKVNEILSSGNRWIVHVFPDQAPNAFAIGGRHVYITTGLIKLLTHKEVEAVLIHEIYHNKDMHIWRNVAAESSFLYLCAFIAVSSMSAGVVLPLALIIFHIMRLSLRTIYTRFQGRHFEIKSDEYAVKKGYGTELISALKKVESWAKEHMSRQVCGKICQLERKISNEIDEHPPTKKRIEIILRKQKELDQAMGSGFKAIESFVSGVFKQNG